MSTTIEIRESALRSRLEQMRQMDEWHLFQQFVLGLLPHDGYQDVRLSNVRNDFGRDGVGLTPQGERCFVACSFDASLAKARHDAKRWHEDPNREPAEVMMFACATAPTERTISSWRAKIEKEHGLELRLYGLPTLLKTGTREGVWRETCARLGIPGVRQGYRRVAPYDGDLARQALRARPPEWLGERVQLAEWAELSPELRSRIILGKPGSGKTTTLLQQLELARPENLLVVERDLRETSQIEGLLDDAAGGAVIVFDDVQDNLEAFRDLCLLARKEDEPEIAAQYQQVLVLAAARSQEWRERQGELPGTALEDLELSDGAEIVLTALSEEQCSRLIELCRDEWKLEIEPRLAKQAAAAAAARDATPLFELSVLAVAKSREDRRLLDEHLAGLPEEVLGLWRRYWRDLAPVEQAILRVVKLFHVVAVDAGTALLAAAAKTFQIPPHDLEAGLANLERSLWLARSGGAARCLDVQLEAIQLEESAFELWDGFVFEGQVEDSTRVDLHLGTGVTYFQTRRARATTRAVVRSALVGAARHFSAIETQNRTLGKSPLAALALNNLSVVQGDLAGMEPTREGRRGWLERAVVAVEESVRLYRELGVQGDLAGALNNASNFYSALAGIEPTEEGRRGWLERAVVAAEESVRLYRELDVQGGLAMSLNNASNRYSDLAGMEPTGEGRREWLERAVYAVEESVRIRRELGVQGALAKSLGASARHYRRIAEEEADAEASRKRLLQSQAAIREAVVVLREVGERRYYLLSLQESVITLLLMAQQGEAIDHAELAELRVEGRHLAEALEDEQALTFFRQFETEPPTLPPAPPARTAKP